MFNIRNNVFETNSSSTHSLIMCLDSDYTRWENDELFLNRDLWIPTESEFGEETFVTKEQLIDILVKSKYSMNEEKLRAASCEEFVELAARYGFYTYDNFENDSLEWFDSTFTTPSGEVVRCFGQYGYDG